MRRREFDDLELLCRDFRRSFLILFSFRFFFFFNLFAAVFSGMEETEQILDSKEDGLKNGTDPPDGAFKKVSTEIKNGDGNMMEEVKNYGDENNSFEELKKARNAVDGEEKKNLEKTKDDEKKKEVEVQNGNDMKFVVEGKDGEVNRVLERVDDARDKKSAESVEDVKFNSETHGLGDVEAIGGKSKEEGSNPIDDIYVKELKNGKNDGVDKPTSGEQDENSLLVQVKENDGGKARKEVKDMEMMGTEDVVEKEAPDVKDEGKFVVREGGEEKKVKRGNADKTVGDNEKAKSLKRKRGRGQRPSETGEAKKNVETKENVQETEVKGSGKRSKEVLSTPVVSSSDRPVRERKTVERLVEVIEKGPDSTVIIEKGRGTSLREIPNVAYKLSRKKPAELKLLHQTLFGRKGKAVDFKNNLLQFSGFAWHESEEKQRAKIKEKLDKCVKETLLELCDLFDLTVSKTSTKKDEIIVKVLDFLEAPQAMSDAMHAEKQSSNSRKRERASKVDASKSSGGNKTKRSDQKHDKTEGTPNSDVKSSHDNEEDDADKDSEEDEDDLEEQSQKEYEVRIHSESDAEKELLVETGDEDEIEADADLRKGKEKKDVKKSPKKQVSSDSVKRKIGSNSKKNSPKTDVKSSLKTPPSKHPKDKKSNDAGEKAFSRNKKDGESPKKSKSKSNSKEKSSGKASKSKAKSGKEQKSGPTKAELMKSICEILKQVDFNTATFTDILKQLASEYKIDLTPRKAAIKVMIQEELTKMADEEEDEESQDEEEMQ